MVKVIEANPYPFGFILGKFTVNPEGNCWYFLALTFLSVADELSHASRKFSSLLLVDETSERKSDPAIKTSVSHKVSLVKLAKDDLFSVAASDLSFAIHSLTLSSPHSSKSLSQTLSIF